MKKRNKWIALAMAILIMAGMAVGCAQNALIEIHSPGEDDRADDETVFIDLSLEMVPLTASPAMFTVLETNAPGTQTKSNNKATIDYSNSADGYIMVKFANSTTKELRVIVQGPSGTKYQYTLKKDASYEVYPLSDGNGKYSVGVYEQVDGSKYATAVSATIDVKLKDEFAPFIRPNQYVNFSKDSKTVAKAADLVKNAKNLTETVDAVYNYVVANLTYDNDFANEVAAGKHAGYVPDVDSVIAKGKGICFDYAAVMTAMLRSQGVPTRLVVGYAGKAYHAWIDVYSETDGWISSVIYFDGKDWNRMDPTFASSGKQSAEVMKYIGDGKNYTAQYLY